MPARGEADDPAPGGSASPMTPGQFGDHERTSTGVDEELGIDRLCRDRVVSATEVVSRGRRERVLAPSAGIVHEDRHWPEARLCGIEDSGRHGRVGEVSFKDDTATPEVGDSAGHAATVLAARQGVLGWEAFLGFWEIKAQVPREDVRTEPRQLHGTSGADAVVGARNNSNLPSTTP